MDTRDIQRWFVHLDVFKCCEVARTLPIPETVGAGPVGAQSVPAHQRLIMRGNVAQVVFFQDHTIGAVNGLFVVAQLPYHLMRACPQDFRRLVERSQAIDRGVLCEPATKRQHADKDCE